MDTATSAVDSGPAINTRSDRPGYLNPENLRSAAEEIVTLRARIGRLQVKADAYEVLVRLIGLVDQRPMNYGTGEQCFVDALLRAAKELEEQQPVDPVNSAPCPMPETAAEIKAMLSGTYADGQPYRGAELPRSQSSTGKYPEGEE